jgi:mRNA interferase MazF
LSDKETKPNWIKPRILGAPKVRQIFWCDFWVDAQLPEMWKTRPVIVVSHKNTLLGPCLVVPTSTEPQDENQWAVRLNFEISSGKKSWAICNQPSTIAVSRLSQFSGRIPILPQADFNQVIEVIRKWIPSPLLEATK